MLRLNNNYQDETTQQDVQNKILRSADVFINCLHGEHDNRAADPVIPDFLESEQYFVNSGLMLSKLIFTPILLPNSFFRLKGSNCFQLSSKTKSSSDPHLLTINQPYIHSIRKYTDKYQTFQFPNTFNQPRRSIAQISPWEGVEKFPLRSKMNVRDYQYFRRPAPSIKARIGSYYLQRTNSQKARTVGESISEGSLG